MALYFSDFLDRDIIIFKDQLYKIKHIVEKLAKANITELSTHVDQFISKYNEIVGPSPGKTIKVRSPFSMPISLRDVDPEKLNKEFDPEPLLNFIKYDANVLKKVLLGDYDTYKNESNSK